MADYPEKIFFGISLLAGIAGALFIAFSAAELSLSIPQTGFNCGISLYPALYFQYCQQGVFCDIFLSSLDTAIKLPFINTGHALKMKSYFSL
jgi:hypothetical protein